MEARPVNREAIWCRHVPILCAYDLEADDATGSSGLPSLAMLSIPLVSSPRASLSTGVILAERVGVVASASTSWLGGSLRGSTLMTAES